MHNIDSSICYTLGVTTLYALGLTPVVFVLSELLFGCRVLSYAEGTAAILGRITRLYVALGQFVHYEKLDCAGIEGEVLALTRFRNSNGALGRRILDAKV